MAIDKITLGGNSEKINDTPKVSKREQSEKAVQDNSQQESKMISSNLAQQIEQAKKQNNEQNLVRVQELAKQFQSGGLKFDSKLIAQKLVDSEQLKTLLQ